MVKKISILLIAALILSSPIVAQENYHRDKKSNSSSTSKATSSSNSKVNAAGGNATATGGNAFQSQSANNSQVSSFNAVRQTPPAYAPDVFQTAPCMVGGSGGFGDGRFAISLGGSKADKDCQLMELARLFAVGLNNRHAAAKTLCHTKAAKRAGLTWDDCQAFIEPVVAKPEPVVAPTPTVIYVTPPQAPLAPPIVVAPPVVTPPIDVKPKPPISKKPKQICDDKK